MRRFEVSNWTMGRFIGALLLFSMIVPGVIQRIKTHRVSVDGSQYQVLVDASARQVQIMSTLGPIFVFPAEGGKLISRQAVRYGQSLVQVVDHHPTEMEQRIWTHYYGPAASATERK